MQYRIWIDFHEKSKMIYHKFKTTVEITNNDNGLKIKPFMIDKLTRIFFFSESPVNGAKIVVLFMKWASDNELIKSDEFGNYGLEMRYNEDKYWKEYKENGKTIITYINEIHNNNQ